VRRYSFWLLSFVRHACCQLRRSASEAWYRSSPAAQQPSRTAGQQDSNRTRPPHRADRARGHSFSAENGESRQPGRVSGFCFSYVMYVASCVGQPVKLGTGAAQQGSRAAGQRGSNRTRPPHRADRARGHSFSAENGGSRQPGGVGGFCFSYVMYVASCVGQPVKLGTGAATAAAGAVSMRGTMQ